jgi:hypothetical protein
MCRVEISFTCYSSLEVLFFLRLAGESLYPTKLKETIEGRNIAGLGPYLPAFAACVCLGMNLSGIRELFCWVKKKMTTHRLCI